MRVESRHLTFRTMYSMTNTFISVTGVNNLLPKPKLNTTDRLEDRLEDRFANSHQASTATELHDARGMLIAMRPASWVRGAIGFWVMILCFFAMHTRAIAEQASPLPMQITLATYSEHLPLIQALKFEPCPRLNTKEKANQVLLEATLLCEALAAGGLSFNFEFIGLPSQSRALSQMHRGELAITSYTLWKSEHQVDDLYLSKALVVEGGLVKGLYMSPDNPALKQIHEREDIQNLSAVGSKEWRQDWQAMTCLGGKNIHQLNHERMIKMVHAQRVDFTLQRFPSNTSLSHYPFGFELVPIENFKITFPGSLHFLVSKLHPQGETIYAALQQGLVQLDQSGRLYEAYKNLGFYNKTVENWQEVGCSDWITQD